MAFSGFISTIKQCAKDLNTLAQKIANDAKTKFGPTVDKVKDGIDVVKAGADVVSTVVSDVTGDNVTIRSIQKGAADFDEKWDAFAKEINDKFNAASPAGKADILETFVKSNFGDDIFNLGSAIKNELPGVLDGLADYKEVVDSFGVGAKTAEEKAKKIQSGADKIIKATEKVAGSLNEAVKTCTGKGYPVLDQLSKIGGTAAVDNLNKALNLGVAGATTATAANELKNAVKGGDLRGITDAMAKGATSVNDLLSQLNTLVPGFPKAQIPTQITTSIKRLQDGQAVYDAARSTLTALVADASGPMTVASLATLTSHFDKNWDNFSDKIDALFQVTPGKGQQAVLETVAKSMFGENVFYAGGAIKRQLPGVLTGVAGVQEAINTFGGSYRDPIEAATKIRSGVEKMVQSVEKISQSLNNMVKFYQGKGDISKGTGYPLLDTLGKLGDTKGIKALDTALRIGGGAAAVVGNAGALSEAIKNKDIKGTVAAAKKTIDDIKKLTKKGDYKADKLTIGNASGGGNGGNTGKAANAQNNQQQQNQNNNNQKQLSGAATNSYVCSGATMRCTMGTSQASLTVLPIRTVNLTGKPMANISDHLSFVNLGQFGRCRSLGFPATAAATAAAHGKLTPMPCVHNTPFPWMGGKNDYIIKGDPALLKSSKCQCMWGGTISLVTDGQTYTGPADLSRKLAESFSIKQNNRRIEPLDIQSITPSTVAEKSKSSNTSDQILQATNNKSGDSNTSTITPYTEAEKHYQELLVIDKKKLESLPTSWILAYNQAVKNINTNYKKDDISKAFSDIELAHNIYKLATSSYAKKLGYNNISYMMPHQIFEIADKVSNNKVFLNIEQGVVPDFLVKMPKKQFWDSFDKYIPLYTNIYSQGKCNAYYSPYYESVVISVDDDINIKRFKDSDWFKSGLLHHEFGHAYDHNHGWKNSDKFKTLYEDFKKEIKEAEKNGSSVGDKINGYIKMKKDEYVKKYNKYPQSHSDYLTGDEIEMLTKISDCLQAATDNHIKVFGGHQETIEEERDPLTGKVTKKFVPGYFDEKVNPNALQNQIAEFIAHASENYWSGNELFEQMLPETYGKMQQLFKDEWTIPNTKGKRMPIGTNRTIIL